jgi:DNA-3-methyladenine glycosylase I
MKNQNNSKLKTRCPWVGDDERMQVCHDTVWGRPTKDDTAIFKAIVLDTNQAGLSWKCILHKEKNFANAYADFDAKKIARFGDKDIARLMNDAGIIRNRLKVSGTIQNAKKFLEIQKSLGLFQNTFGNLLAENQSLKNLVPAEISTLHQKSLTQCQKI